jgi:small GTP-binding protein
MDPSHIRNFSIIAHIDHGKSTLADRLLELTGTIEKRKMQEQVLDSMELERERGITIKMQPVRMKYTFKKPLLEADFVDGMTIEPKQIEPKEGEYVLNLIDTPGHIDFSYEVSRALKAVEGSILLVDATQGVQAQTLTTLNMAREAGLTIIPTVSKIDSPLARTEEVVHEVCQLLNCPPGDVLKVSGKTGEGVEHLLEEIIKRVPAPTSEEKKKGRKEEKENEQNEEFESKSMEAGTSSEGAPESLARGWSGFSAENTRTPRKIVPAEMRVDKDAFRSLIFDFQYSNHTGVIVYVRVMSGAVHRHDKLIFKISGRTFEALEVGIFSPDNVPMESLSAGEIGYIVTGIKEPGVASVGDTVASVKDTLPPLPGYQSSTASCLGFCLSRIAG